MAGGPTPYEEKLLTISDLAGMLLSIYDAAAQPGDAPLFNVVKHAEHNPAYPRELLETLARRPIISGGP